MPWLQLKLPIDRTEVDEISDYLTELGALSITYEDALDAPILEPAPGETPLWEALFLTALFDAQSDTQFILQELKQHTITEKLDNLKFEQLEDKDWEREWMENFKPMSFGDRLWIVPSWHQPPDTEAVNILLDPGLAFGTGTHETTSLCLQWLDQADVSNKKVLDYGCGSGILAIAAAKLNAKEVSAVDIDPQAITATQDNMQRNGLAGDEIYVGQPPLVDGQQFDIVIANILAAPLKSLASAITALVHPGGTLVLSGLLIEQAEEVTQSYKKWFTMQPAVNQNEWVRLVGVKKADN